MWLGGEPQYIDGCAKAIPEVGTPSVEWSGVASLYQQHRRTEHPSARPGLSAAATAAAAAAPITGVRKIPGIATREFIQTSFLLYVYYNSVTWLLTIYFLFPDHGAVFCDSL